MPTTPKDNFPRTVTSTFSYTFDWILTILRERWRPGNRWNKNVDVVGQLHHT